MAIAQKFRSGKDLVRGLRNKMCHLRNCAGQVVQCRGIYQIRYTGNSFCRNDCRENCTINAG